jgi:tRNA threonylcarbamoyladenosine biosynthesis protein TsaE
MRAHPGPVWLYHADAYRLGDAEELIEAGLDEWLENGVVALEWADRASPVLPTNALVIRIEYSENGRLIRVIAWNGRARELLDALSEA